MSNKHIVAVAAVIFGMLCILLFTVACFIAAAHDTLVDPPVEFEAHCLQFAGTTMLALICGAILFFGSLLVIKATKDGLE